MFAACADRTELCKIVHTFYTVMHVYVYIYYYVCVYTIICTYISVCIHMYVYMYVYIHIFRVEAMQQTLQTNENTINIVQ